MTPRLLYATGPAKMNNKSLYSSNGSSKRTSGRAHVDNAAHRASHNSSLPNVRGHTGPVTHLLCRDLVHGGPKSKITVKHVNRPDEFDTSLVGKSPHEIITFIADVDQYMFNVMKLFVKVAREATQIHVYVQFEFSRNKMSNIVITVTDDLDNIYMKLDREDLECTITTGNSAPLNWIATVPLDADQFHYVYVHVNNEAAIQFETKNEICELYPEFNVIACLIFKNVQGSLCYNWQTGHMNHRKEPCILKSNQESEFNFFEEVLGMNFTEHTISVSSDYKTIVELFSHMDRCVLEFQKNSDHITNALCINASTPLLDDMTFTAKSKSKTIRGAITRQNVVDSIRFDETIPYFDHRLVHEFDDAHLMKSSMVFVQAIGTAMKVRLHNLIWGTCHASMHQEKLGGEFEDNCHHILSLRATLCKMMNTLKISTSHDKNACILLVNMAMQCMDTSLVHNIDVLCDTKDVLHGVCLQFILIKSKIFKQCTMTAKIAQLVYVTMKCRVTDNIDRRNTSFAKIKSPITQFVLKQVLLDSMGQYMESCGVPLDLCDISGTR